MSLKCILFGAEADYGTGSHYKSDFLHEQESYKDSSETSYFCPKILVL